jgi:hypothetical protein
MMEVPLIVYEYAKGDNALKERAIAYEIAYLDGLFFCNSCTQVLLLFYRLKEERPIWVKFLNEVNNPAPDLALRSRYRKETIEQYEKENEGKKEK